MSHFCRKLQLVQQVSITEVILVEAIDQVERADGVPGAVEAPTSEAAFMGGLVRQMDFEVSA